MTAAFIPASHLGMGAVRIEGLMLLAACAAMTVATARALRQPLPLIAGIFVLAQPLTAQLSFGALPQVLFSVVLATALFLRARDHWLASLLVASLLPLARLEGVVVLGVWAVVLFWERHWWRVPALATGVLGWAVVGAVRYRDTFWLLHANRFVTLSSPNTTPGWRFGFTAFPAAFGGIVGGLAIGALVRRRFPDPLVPATAVALVGFYVFAWGYGAFQTGTTAIYLVSVSVPVALCAHHTLVWVFERRRGLPWAEATAIALALPWSRAQLLHARRSQLEVLVVLAVVACGRVAYRRRALPAVATIATAFAVVYGVHEAKPIPLVGGPAASRLALRRLGPAAERVRVFTQPAFGYFAGREGFPSASLFAVQPAGTMVLWDSSLSPGYGWPESRMSAAGYREQWEVSIGGVREVLFQRSG
jgi:hypothetical protein